MDTDGIVVKKSLFLIIFYWLHILLEIQHIIINTLSSV